MEILNYYNNRIFMYRARHWNCPPPPLVQHVKPSLTNFVIFKKKATMVACSGGSPVVMSFMVVLSPNFWGGGIFCFQFLLNFFTKLFSILENSLIFEKIFFNFVFRAVHTLSFIFPILPLLFLTH